MPWGLAAEQITPYPPGNPHCCQGNGFVKLVEYLVSGRRAGMFLPDASNRELDTIRVVA